VAHPFGGERIADHVARGARVRACDERDPSVGFLFDKFADVSFFYLEVRCVNFSPHYTDIC
jgi:hypothetical protein